MGERASVTGDNDQFPIPADNGICKNCGGSGQLVVSPPHMGHRDKGIVLQNAQTGETQQHPWMRQIPFQAGACQACAGSGESTIKPLPEKEYGKDFLFIQYMSDNWQGEQKTVAEVERMKKELQKYRESPDAPTRDGLRLILQGVGMNQVQAELVVNAVAGYCGIGA